MLDEVIKVGKVAVKKQFQVTRCYFRFPTLCNIKLPINGNFHNLYNIYNFRNIKLYICFKF